MPSAPKWVIDTLELFAMKLPLIEVKTIAYLSSSVKRIRFIGDFSKLDFPVGCHIDFRVSETEFRRYTVSQVDRTTGVLELIVHLHGNGLGRNFMDNLKIGDRINMHKPNGLRKYYDKNCENFIIFGDETSLGLACSFFSILKNSNHKFLFIFELDNENAGLPQLLQLENCLVFPKNNTFQNEKWVRELAIFQKEYGQDTNFILTGNAKSAQTFRKIIRHKTSARIYLQGYWLAGKKGL